MEIKIGTMLILEPTYTERNERFRCKVVEIDEQAIFIDYPINIDTEKTAFLVDGSQFRVTFHSEEAGSYAFTTEVLGRQSSNIPMILLARPNEADMLKIQRREFVRVETSVDVAVEKEGVFQQFVTEDISAGGCAVYLRREAHFQEHDVVNLSIVLPFSNGDMHYVHTAASVVRIFERDEIHLASLKFVDTDDIDKQHIVRFCFDRQVIKRKKELFQK